MNADLRAVSCSELPPWADLPTSARSWDVGHWNYAYRAGLLREARARRSGVCPLCLTRLDKGMPILYTAQSAVHRRCLAVTP